VFCVAGFAFASPQDKKFTKEWSRLFGRYPDGLHMRELAHRIGAFSGIQAAEQHRLMVEAVKIINRHVSAGFAISCNLHEVKLLAPRWVRGFGDAYPLCCHLTMLAVGQFLEKSGSAERVTYVFESGHSSEAETTDFIRSAVQSPQVAESYRYAGAEFLLKSEAVPLQAADMLAWEWAKFRDETLEKGIRPLRRSLRALFENDPKRYSGAHVTGEPLAKFMVQIRELGLLQLREERAKGGSGAG